MIECGHQRGGLAEVSSQMNDLEAWIGCRNLVQDGGRAVGRAIVRKHDFPIVAERNENGRQAVFQGHEVVGFVVHRRQYRLRHGAPIDVPLRGRGKPLELLEHVSHHINRANGRRDARCRARRRCGLR